MFFYSEKTKRLFSSSGVLTETELIARSNTAHENFYKALLIECRCILSLAKTYVLPAALKYQKEVAESYNAAIGALQKPTSLIAQNKLLTQVVNLIDSLYLRTEELENLLQSTEKTVDPVENMKTFHGQLRSSMSKLREICDSIESIVEDSLWPLPKYSEMLFLR